MIFDRVIYAGISLGDLILSLLILIIAVIVGKTISLNLKKSLKDKVSKDRINTISKVVYYTILMIAFLMILPILNVNLSGILVAGGLMAIVIGFASQSIVTNLISGIFLTFERPFRVDDVVTLGTGGEVTGMVEDIRIISTTVRTFDGVYVRIPNEKVFTSNITNYLENVARRFEYDIGIRYSDDADEAMDIIEDVIENTPLALKNPPPQVFVQNLGASAVEIKVRIWAPATDWYSVKMETLWKLKKTLEENGIEVPFTQQEVWFMDQDGHETSDKTFK